MRGSKILITGPTGQVAAPIARALAADNEVWGIARFSDPSARDGLEKAIVRDRDHAVHALAELGQAFHGLESGSRRPGARIRQDAV